ncbi:toxin-antitoxin system, toxin component [Streptomyces sp. NPDC023998]|uniref:toxin-antitoxin system, toxin component n=1 Tax=Streptomyces sp. NPDC023998 TaxID=3154597 RepID=UPI0033E86C7D
MSTKSAMRELRDELARALELAGPSSPDDVFTALCAQLSRRRGRPVVYRLVEFPPRTASGLYLDMVDRDIICIQAHTRPWHQLVIFGHEVWHMVAGHCGQHQAGSAVAGRLVTDDADLNATLHNVAARTDFRQAEEAEAETFGLELGAALRGWLEGADSAAPRSALAQRIHDALGHRQG